MSTLGQVIVFLVCSSPSIDCAPAKMWFTQFPADALPAARSRVERLYPDETLTPVCRDLEDLCKASQAFSNELPRVEHISYRSVQVDDSSNQSGDFARQLAVLCRQQSVPSGECNE